MVKKICGDRRKISDSIHCTSHTLEFNIANHVCWLEPGAILYTYICICICQIFIAKFVYALKTLFIFIPTYIHAYITCMYTCIYLSTGQHASLPQQA